jgi:hypothetical protein
VPDVSAPTGLPPCPGLRGEPCRDYEPFANRSAELSPTTSGNPSTARTQTAGTHKKQCKKPKKHRRASVARKKKRCRK